MRRFFSVAAVLGLSFVAAPAVEAGNAEIRGGGTFAVPVMSYTERFFSTVVRQQFDFSCGSAALATLLTFHYERPTNEATVLKAMFEAGDQQKIREVGFSLLDMKRYLASVGLDADGFSVPLDKLAEAGVPAITLIEINGYRHFVVLKGISDDIVLVGDPALGLKTFERDEFERLRVNDIVFVVRNDLQLAQNHFNMDEDWRLRRPFGPVGQAMNRHGLNNHAVLTQMPSQFRPVRIDTFPGSFQ
jgi:hypothetical protein